ncbi:hypothetical protein HDR61_02420 [bacterium]|nr:hypothetical protein [bacterium]
MRDESGRSLVEIIGILAIGAIMTAGAVSMYSMIHGNQTRAIAAANMEQLVRDTHILMQSRGDYSGISVDYLIKAGALKSDHAPIGGSWSVTAEEGGKKFAINLTELSVGECDYFITAIPQWAYAVRVNGLTIDASSADADNCFSSRTNQISFIVE